MSGTLYASFEDAVYAEKAAGALLDYGVHQADISLLSGSRFAGANGQELDVAEGEVGELPQAPSGLPFGPGVEPVAHPGAEIPSTANKSDDDFEYFDNAAKHGISTTTLADAEAGAAKGAGFGLVLGALAAFVVPGIGWALGGGALAAALSATALATGAGAIAGSAVGYLKDQGVPHVAADHYHGTVAAGGALLTIHLNSVRVNAQTVSQVVAKYHGKNVGIY